MGGKLPRDPGWIGVDLDGTLAKVVPGRFDGTVVGDPIPNMVARVCALLDAGEEVRIFTARVGPHNDPTYDVDRAERAIREWCLRHIGCELPITATKDWRMRELYDDRAIRVERDTGRILSLDAPDAAAVSCVVCDGSGIVAGALNDRVHVLYYGKTLCGFVELPRGDRWVGATARKEHVDDAHPHEQVTCRACRAACAHGGCRQCEWMHRNNV